MLEYFGGEFVDATLYRRAAGSYSSGQWTPGAATSSAIQVIALQPVTARELQMLPDGEHVRNYQKTWSTAAFDTRQGGIDSDRLVVAGKTYEIVQVEDRTVLGAYRKAYLREIMSDE